MTSDPVTIRSDRPLRIALEIMQENTVKHLPVVSSSGHLIGVVSDRDCRYALNSPFTLHEKWQDDELIDSLKIRSVMTPAPIVVEPNAAASEAARLMLTHRIGCLPVMRVETLVGVITRSDILVAFMNIHQHYEHIQNLNGNRTLPEQKKTITDS